MEQKLISTEKPFPLLNLPKDIILEVVSHLSLESFLTLRRVNNHYLDHILLDLFLQKSLNTRTDDEFYLLQSISGLKNLRAKNLFPYSNIVNITKEIYFLSSSKIEFCTFALTQNGEVYVWGQNTNYQLGLGKEYEVCNSAKQLSFKKKIASIAVGSTHTIFLATDGTVYGCGTNDYCQLGFTTFLNKVYTPQQIPSLKDIVSIHVSNYYNIAVAKNGKLYAWGSNKNSKNPRQFIQVHETPQVIRNFFTEDLNNISQREFKKQKFNIIVSQQIKEYCIENLNVFIKLNTSFMQLIGLSENPAIKLATSLKNFIDLKRNTFITLEDEIGIYKNLIKNTPIKNNPVMDKFENCLNVLIGILDEYKKSIVKEIIKLKFLKLPREITEICFDKLNLFIHTKSDNIEFFRPNVTLAIQLQNLIRDEKKNTFTVLEDEIKIHKILIKDNSNFSKYDKILDELMKILDEEKELILIENTKSNPTINYKALKGF